MLSIYPALYKFSKLGHNLLAYEDPLVLYLPRDMFSRTMPATFLDTNKDKTKKNEVDQHFNHLYTLLFIGHCYNKICIAAPKGKNTNRKNGGRSTRSRNSNNDSGDQSVSSDMNINPISTNDNTNDGIIMDGNQNGATNINPMNGTMSDDGNVMNNTQRRESNKGEDEDHFPDTKYPAKIFLELVMKEGKISRDDDNDINIDDIYNDWDGYRIWFFYKDKKLLLRIFRALRTIYIDEKPTGIKSAILGVLKETTSKMNYVGNKLQEAQVSEKNNFSSFLKLFSSAQSWCTSLHYISSLNEYNLDHMNITPSAMETYEDVSSPYHILSVYSVLNQFGRRDSYGVSGDGDDSCIQWDLNKYMADTGFYDFPFEQITYFIPEDMRRPDILFTTYFPHMNKIPQSIYSDKEVRNIVSDKILMDKVSDCRYNPLSDCETKDMSIAMMTQRDKISSELYEDIEKQYKDMINDESVSIKEAEKKTIKRYAFIKKKMSEYMQNCLGFTFSYISTISEQKRAIADWGDSELYRGRYVNENPLVLNSYSCLTDVDVTLRPDIEFMTDLNMIYGVYFLYLNAFIVFYVSRTRHFSNSPILYCAVHYGPPQVGKTYVDDINKTKSIPGSFENVVYMTPKAWTGKEILSTCMMYLEEISPDDMGAGSDLDGNMKRGWFEIMLRCMITGQKINVSECQIIESKIPGQSKVRVNLKTTIEARGTAFVINMNNFVYMLSRPMLSRCLLLIAYEICKKKKKTNGETSQTAVERVQYYPSFTHNAHVKQYRFSLAALMIDMDAFIMTPNSKIDLSVFNVIVSKMTKELTELGYSKSTRCIQRCSVFAQAQRLEHALYENFDSTFSHYKRMNDLGRGVMSLKNFSSMGERCFVTESESIMSSVIHLREYYMEIPFKDLLLKLLDKIWPNRYIIKHVYPCVAPTHEQLNEMMEENYKSTSNGGHGYGNRGTINISEFAGVIPTIFRNILKNEKDKLEKNIKINKYIDDGDYILYDWNTKKDILSYNEEELNKCIPMNDIYDDFSMNNDDRGGSGGDDDDDDDDVVNIDIDKEIEDHIRGDTGGRSNHENMYIDEHEKYYFVIEGTLKDMAKVFEERSGVFTEDTYMLLLMGMMNTKIETYPGSGVKIPMLRRKNRVGKIPNHIWIACNVFVTYICKQLFEDKLLKTLKLIKINEENVTTKKKLEQNISIFEKYVIGRKNENFIEDLVRRSVQHKHTIPRNILLGETKIYDKRNMEPGVWITLRLRRNVENVFTIRNPLSEMISKIFKDDPARTVNEDCEENKENNKSWWRASHLQVDMPLDSLYLEMTNFLYEHNEDSNLKLLKRSDYSSYLQYVKAYREKICDIIVNREQVERDYRDGIKKLWIHTPSDPLLHRILNDRYSKIMYVDQSKERIRNQMKTIKYPWKLTILNHVKDVIFNPYPRKLHDKVRDEMEVDYLFEETMEIVKGKLEEMSKVVGNNRLRGDKIETMMESMEENQIAYDTIIDTITDFICYNRYYREVLISLNNMKKIHSCLKKGTIYFDIFNCYGFFNENKKYAHNDLRMNIWRKIKVRQLSRNSIRFMENLLNEIPDDAYTYDEFFDVIKENVPESSGLFKNLIKSYIEYEVNVEKIYNHEYSGYVMYNTSGDGSSWIKKRKATKISEQINTDLVRDWSNIDPRMYKKTKLSKMGTFENDNDDYDDNDDDDDDGDDVITNFSNMNNSSSKTKNNVGNEGVETDEDDDNNIGLRWGSQNVGMSSRFNMLADEGIII